MTTEGHFNNISVSKLSLNGKPLIDPKTGYLNTTFIPPVSNFISRIDDLNHKVNRQDILLVELLSTISSILYCTSTNENTFTFDHNFNAI